MHRADLREHFTCPICYNVFRDPVVITSCQHTFCRSCLSASLAIKSACPVCRKVVFSTITDIATNLVVGNVINDNKSLFYDDDVGPTIQAILKLSITERYAPTWKPRQGVREIIQNWYDGVNEQVVESQGTTNLMELNKDVMNIAVERRRLDPTNTKEDESNCVIIYKATFQGRVYGIVEYNPATQVLSVTNRNVSLSRRILLLGSSSKVGKNYLVGQFGEGLKIGILALVRENKRVAMSTNGESWAFGLHHDGQYGENVLGVTVEKDNGPVKLGGDTCTTVSNLSPADWKLFSHDFLFLTRPKEFCDTINGTLLLDTAHKHKLFVKGFWICDMKEAGLIYGVNLHHMELDRDRRAVVQKHDIENKVADIWSKAITVRKDILPMFYDLLMMNDEMISKAQWYISEEGVKLLSGYFLSTEGQNAQPVLNTRKDDVLLVEHTLKRKAVLCPEPLYNILTKSKLLQPLDEVLKAHVNATNDKVPRDNLTKEENSALDSVFALLHKIIDPSQLSDDDVEIFASNFATENKVSDFARARDGKLQLSRYIFDVDKVHEHFNRCTSIAGGVYNKDTNKCNCIETCLMTTLMTLKAESKSSNFQMRQSLERLMMERMMEKLVGMALAGKSQ